MAAVIAKLKLAEGDHSHAQIADTLLMLRENGYKTSRLQSITGYPDYKIRHYLRLAKKLNPSVMTLLHEAKIKFSLARAIASLPPDQQEEETRKILMLGTSVHRFRAKLNNNEFYLDRKTRDYFEKLEMNMSEQSGLMLSIKPNPRIRNSGEVVLQYTDLDGFDLICERLNMDLSQL